MSFHRSPYFSGPQSPCPKNEGTDTRLGRPLEGLSEVMVQKAALRLGARERQVFPVLRKGTDWLLRPHLTLTNGASGRATGYTTCGEQKGKVLGYQDSETSAKTFQGVENTMKTYKKRLRRQEVVTLTIWPREQENQKIRFPQLKGESARKVRKTVCA